MRIEHRYSAYLHFYLLSSMTSSPHFSFASLSRFLSYGYGHYYCTHLLPHPQIRSAFVDALCFPRYRSCHCSITLASLLDVPRTVALQPLTQFSCAPINYMLSVHISETVDIGKSGGCGNIPLVCNRTIHTLHNVIVTRFAIMLSCWNICFS